VICVHYELCGYLLFEQITTSLLICRTSIDHRWWNWRK